MSDKTAWRTRYRSAQGRIIRKLREAQRPRMSQEKLARMVEMSFTTISDIERGVTQPRDTTIQAIAEALGCDPFDLYPTRRDLPPEGSAVPPTTSEPQSPPQERGMRYRPGRPPGR